MRKDKLVAVVGPTAVGKTRLSIKIAQRINAEIVSADSMQIYKYMNIGTAKVLPNEMKGITHHLIDVVEPTEKFSVACYQKMAQGLIEDINNNGKVPLMVGGTGLYLKAVIDDYSFSRNEPDWTLRDELKDRITKYGNKVVHDELVQIDPKAARRIHRNDERRIIRALEVYYNTGRPLTDWEEEREARLPIYNQVLIGLTRERTCLYERIEQRVDIMVEQGLIEEVKYLLDNGMSFIAKQALGYKEIIDYLEGSYSLSEAIDTIKQETRHYAKRQLTWFRNDKRIKWFSWDEYTDIVTMTDAIVDYIEGHFQDKENRGNI